MPIVLKKHIRTIVVLLLSFMALFAILHLDAINSFLDYLMFVLRPLTIGLVLAYLCNPIFRLFENKLFYGMRLKGMRRALSLLLTYIVLFLIFVILFLLIVPQLINSILDFLGNYQNYLVEAINSANEILATVNQIFSTDIAPLEYESILHTVSGLLEQIEIQSFLESLISFSTISSLLTTLGDVFYIFTDIILGIFISLYILNTKEKRYAQVMRLRRALFSDSFNARLTALCTTADRSFGGFLRGKTLDSTLVGIMVYIIISLMNVPYSLLIAVIIGITDIVPVIGPFIGVIPSAVIILLTDPIKVIPFLLCILVVQQIDGNIVAPKILGDNIGVSSLCVLISITIMGAIWGLLGMVLGVPLFATVLELGDKYLDKRLSQKGLYVPTESGDEGKKKPSKKDLKTEQLYEGIDRTAFGKGTLTEREKDALRAYKTAMEHGAMTSFDEETLAAFASAYHQQVPPTESTDTANA